MQLLLSLVFLINLLPGTIGKLPAAAVATQAAQPIEMLTPNGLDTRIDIGMKLSECIHLGICPD